MSRPLATQHRGGAQERMASGGTWARRRAMICWTPRQNLAGSVAMPMRSSVRLFSQGADDFDQEEDAASASRSKSTTSLSALLAQHGLAEFGNAFSTAFQAQHIHTREFRRSSGVHRRGSCRQ
jgi:hypothetical protein